MTRGAPLTGPRRLAGHDRQVQALDLRRAGASYRQIAAQLGVTVSSAHKAVTAGLRATLQEPADDVRALEAQRLDALTMAAWPKAMKGDLHAIATCLAIMGRRARMLGVDVDPAAGRTLIVGVIAQRIAAESGLDPAEVIAEAERIVALAGQDA